MRCKKTLLSLIFSVLALTSRPAAATVDPDTIAVAVATASAATVMGVTCYSLLKAGGGEILMAEARRLLKKPANKKAANILNENLVRRELILREQTKLMNEQQFGSEIQLQVNTRSDLFLHIGESMDERARQARRMSKTLGGEVATQVYGLQLSMNEHAPVTVLKRLAGQDEVVPNGPPRSWKLDNDDIALVSTSFDLSLGAWPINVTPKMEDGSAFDKQMQLGLYIYNDKARVMMSTEQINYMNPGLDKKWASYRHLEGRLHDWETELEALQNIHVTFKMSPARSSSLTSQGPFGSFRKMHAVFEVEGAKDEQEELRAYLFLLRKIAAQGKLEARNPNPAFKDFYLTAEKVQEFEKASEELKNHRPKLAY